MKTAFSKNPLKIPLVVRLKAVPIAVRSLPGVFHLRRCEMACVTKRRGRYVIDCYDQNGKRYRKTLPEGTTKQRAREILRDIEIKIERRTFAHEKKIPTFSEVAQEWIEYKKPSLRETTWEVYQGHVRKHFNELKDSRIDQVSMAKIEKWFTSRQAAKMPLATIRRISVTLNGIMSYAVRHRYTDFNPVRDIEKPRSQGKDAEEGKINYLTPEQINVFLERVTEQKYHTLFLTAIMTGARQGEILGLKWSDVDFEMKQVHIRRTFNHGRFFTPKTKGSARRIDLAPVLVRELAKWKLASGNNDLVFPSEVDTPVLHENLVRRHFKPALKAAGLPDIRFHDLRHTYASLLFAQGENIKYISSQLGHASATITLDVYSHLMKSENQEAVCKLENTIFQATGHNLVTNENKGLTING